jgi:hypothetical protein
VTPVAELSIVAPSEHRRSIMGMREGYQERIVACLKDLNAKLVTLKAEAGPAMARFKQTSRAAWKEAKPGMAQAWRELRSAVQKAWAKVKEIQHERRSRDT